jgi:hypothetical protein
MRWLMSGMMTPLVDKCLLDMPTCGVLWNACLARFRDVGNVYIPSDDHSVLRVRDDDDNDDPRSPLNLICIDLDGQECIPWCMTCFHCRYEGDNADEGDLIDEGHILLCDLSHLAMSCESLDEYRGLVDELLTKCRTCSVSEFLIHLGSLECWSKTLPEEKMKMKCLYDRVFGPWLRPQTVYLNDTMTKKKSSPNSTPSTTKKRKSSFAGNIGSKGSGNVDMESLSSQRIEELPSKLRSLCASGEEFSDVNIESILERLENVDFYCKGTKSNGSNLYYYRGTLSLNDGKAVPFDKVDTPRRLLKRVLLLLR